MFWNRQYCLVFLHGVWRYGKELKPLQVYGLEALAMYRIPVEDAIL